MICSQYDVVEVPFPFVDTPAITKKRKALVISKYDFNIQNSATILCMITSATNSKWFGDIPIKQLEEAGLRKSCVMRFKIFTLDNSLILNICGKLSKIDQENYENMKNKFI
ncbi:type II toxin-antitoxin system PemK/MazF family toxin [Fluviispira multicolorata]|uniref:Type II toxin-antitoxin system PemK/MazF family toxin n=1 Tax=Fluviispira multicolorata TaxID=2654512 RepID=A0A833JAH9_9BACT|nr:type II toxin-antitoxin system PemK/MazF family toxin [Fluviispira multicolorata]KAB8027991.1 type II toxin-antitoxin system PemK/MazF family toxin [Fluviispira multicolorata]